MKLTKKSASVEGKSIELEGEYGGWKLTSGKKLEQFAEQGGYLAPLLLMTSNMAGLGDWLKKRN